MAPEVRLIARIARDLHEDCGHDAATAAALAIGTVTRWARGGNADARAALNEWEAPPKMERAITGLVRQGVKMTPEEEQTVGSRASNRLLVAEGLVLTLGADGARGKASAVRAAHLLAGGDGGKVTISLDEPAVQAADVERALTELQAEVTLDRLLVEATRPGLRTSKGRFHGLHQREVGVPKGRLMRGEGAAKCGDCGRIKPSSEAHCPTCTITPASTNGAEATPKPSHGSPHAVDALTAPTGGLQESTGPRPMVTPDPRPKGPKGRNGQGNPEFEKEHPRAAKGRTGGGKWVSKGAGMEGQPSTHVQQLQQRLHALGYNVIVDGRFGDQTHAAVLQFQRDRGLKPSGIVDRHTTVELRSPAGPNEQPPPDQNPGQQYGDQFRGNSPQAKQNRAAQDKSLGVTPPKKAAPKKSAATGTTPKATGGQTQKQASGADAIRQEIARLQQELKTMGGGGTSPTTSGGTTKSKSKSKASKPSGLARGAGMVGTPDPKVRDLQEKLRAAGYSLGAPGVDGRFGPLTEAALKKFQSAQGIKASGVADNKTLSAFANVKSTPKAKTTPKPKSKPKAKPKTRTPKATTNPPTKRSATPTATGGKRQLVAWASPESVRDNQDVNFARICIRLEEAIAQRKQAAGTGDMEAFTLWRAREEVLRRRVLSEDRVEEGWIGKMHMKKGQLHRDLGCPEDKPIPKGKIEAAAADHKDPKVQARAKLALRLMKMHGSG